MARRVRIQLDLVAEFDGDLDTLPLWSEHDAVAVASGASASLKELCNGVVEVSLRGFRFSLDDRPEGPGL